MSECPHIARDMAHPTYDRQVTRADGYVYFMRRLGDDPTKETPVQFCRVAGTVHAPLVCSRELDWSRCRWRGMAIIA